MKILYFKDYKWLLSLNKQIRNDFLVEDCSKHWLIISNLFFKDIKVKIRYSPDDQY